MDPEERPHSPPRRRLLHLLAGAGVLAGIVGGVMGLFILIATGIWHLPGIRKSVDTGKRAMTVVELEGIETALLEMLADAEVGGARLMFNSPQELLRPSIEETLAYHTEIAYALLNEGKNANVDLKQEAREKLDAFYLNLRMDAWGNPFVIYFGPWRRGDHEGFPTPPFISFPVNGDTENVSAPAGKPFYLLSRGPNGRLDQPYTSSADSMAKSDDVGSWLEN